MTISLSVMFLLGVTLGYIINTVLTYERPIGKLRIDTSDPDDGPYMFLELETTPTYVEKQKYIRLEVINENYISQK